jgi:hypothetical protein
VSTPLRTTVEPPVERPTRSGLLDLLKRGRALMPPSGQKAQHPDGNLRNRWRQEVQAAIDAEMEPRNEAERAELQREAQGMPGASLPVFDIGPVDIDGRRFGIRVSR